MQKHLYKGNSFVLFWEQEEHTSRTAEVVIWRRRRQVAGDRFLIPLHFIPDSGDTDLTILAHNVSAPVPAAIANLTKLHTINLAYNRLYGGIPAFLGPDALPDLTFLRLDGNRLTGAIPPTATVFDLSVVGNLLTGPLPASFGDVDLTDNRLTGDVSMLFGAKKQLNALHLSRNPFKCNLGGVELPEAMDILEIDHNMVYGSIPAAAAARKWLAFDVSYNQLCGPIPQGRYTHRFGAKHFAGNKCLCNRPLPPCNS